MTFRSPNELAFTDEISRILTAYYRGWDTAEFAFTGAKFDRWPENDLERFTADDLVAVSFLSVTVRPRAAYILLVSEADKFNRLLAAVSQEAELHSQDSIEDGWWDLMVALNALPDVGPTTASKLFARKRPHLRPIYDSVVEQFLGSDRRQWEPVREALRADPELVQRIQTAVDSSPVPPGLSVLRALDVVCWCVGRRRSPQTD